jgi:hypothetical protein
MAQDGSLERFARDPPLGEYRERDALSGDDRHPAQNPDDLCFSRTKLWYRLAIG